MSTLFLNLNLKNSKKTIMLFYLSLQSGENTKKKTTLVENTPKVPTQTKEVIQTVLYFWQEECFSYHGMAGHTANIRNRKLNHKKSENSHVRISSYLFRKDLGDYQSNLLKIGKEK